MNNSIYVPIFFLLFGIVATYFGISIQMENASLQQSGIVVQSLDIEGNTDFVINGTHSVREINPNFKTQGGKVVNCRAKINDEIQANLSQNPIVDIRYLVENPEVCEVVGNDRNSNIAPLILGVIAIIGSLVVFVRRRKQQVKVTHSVDTKSS